MADIIDSPARHTRSKAHTEELLLSPKRDEEENDQILANSKYKKKIQLTPIPPHHSRVPNSNKGIKASDKANDIIFEQRCAARGVNAKQTVKASNPQKTVKISENTLQKLQQFRSPSLERHKACPRSKEEAYTQQGPITPEQQGSNGEVNNTSVCSVSTDNLADNSFATCLNMSVNDSNNSNNSNNNPANQHQEMDQQKLKNTNPSTEDTQSDQEIDFPTKTATTVTLDNKEPVKDIADMREEGTRPNTPQSDDGAEEPSEEATLELPEDATPTERVLFQMMQMMQSKLTQLETTKKKRR